MADEFSSDNRVLGMVLSQMRSLDESVREVGRHVQSVETKVTDIRERVTVVEGKVNILPCNTHAKEIGALKDAIKHKLSWRALLTASIPGLVAGAVLGAKFL